MAPHSFGFDTRAVHAGQRPDPHTGARAVPIFQTTSYVFEDTDAAAAYFNLQEYGNTYSRIMTPTVAAFEERVASLEGGTGAVAFASGLAAQAAALFTMLEPGDHVVASAALYGGTVTQLKHLARKLGLALTFVDPDQIDAWRQAVRSETKLLYGEAIRNPGGNVLDLRAVADVADEIGAPLMIDNTFATPYLCRPIEWGADIVIHSATKFLGGHGTSIGGVVTEAGTFDWSNGRFPVVADPSPAYHGLQFHETFGTYGYLMKLRAETLRDLGAALSLAVAGGRLGGQALIRGVTLWSHLANVGDAKSLIIHPASTTHRQLSDDELRAAGVGPGTIRLSVGIESIEDLIWDLEQGFARAA